MHATRVVCFLTLMLRCSFITVDNVRVVTRWKNTFGTPQKFDWVQLAGMTQLATHWSPRGQVYYACALIRTPYSAFKLYPHVRTFLKNALRSEIKTKSSL